MKSDNPDGSPPYEVGYGKPPVRNRFQKGRSGNPRGRKKTERVEDLGALLTEILAEEITITDGGRRRRMTTLEAMLQAQRINALQADPNALRMLFKLAHKSGMLKPSIQEQKNVELLMPTGDRARILRAYRAEQAKLKQAAFGVEAPSEAQ